MLKTCGKTGETVFLGHELACALVGSADAFITNDERLARLSSSRLAIYSLDGFIARKGSLFESRKLVLEVQTSMMNDKYFLLNADIAEAKRLQQEYKSRK